jgi:tungstate transport system substrate-binding protein
MAEALRIANEKQAYTLADRGTFLALRKGLELTILSEREPLLRNNYAVIIVSAEKHPHLNVEAAKTFADFLVDPGARQLIAKFGVDKFGEPLFIPEQSAATR